MLGARRRRTSSWRQVAAALALLAVAGACAVRESARRGRTMTEARSIRPISLPFGIADAGARVGCFEGRDGALECLDLASGELLARSASAWRPLYVEAGQVVAWRQDEERPSDLELRRFTLAGGALTPAWTVRVELPAWVRVAPAAGHRFRLTAELAGGELVARWQASGRFAGGAAPPRDVLAEASAGAGVFRCDLGDGKVAGALELGEPRPDPALTEHLYRLPLVPHRVGVEDEVRESWPLGEREALLVSEDRSGSPGLFLHHLARADRSTLSEVRLTGDANAEVRVGPDGAHLFARVAPGGAPSEVWQAFAADDGAPVATVPWHPGTVDLGIAGGRVILAVDEESSHPETYEPWLRRTLEAYDAASGDWSWSHVLREEAAEATPADLERWLPGVSPPE